MPVQSPVGQRSGLRSASGGAASGQFGAGMSVRSGAQALALRRLWQPTLPELTVLSGGAYLAQVVADGPSAYFPMWERSGHVVDVVAGLASTVETSLTYAAAGPLASGDSGAVGTGTVGVLQVPSSGGIQNADGPLTIEMWVKKAQLATTGYVAS